MNDAKLVLAKKKELLEECRRRKKEREIQKNLETSGAYKTGLTTKYLHNGEENGKRNDLTKEFENLTADEILRKCGINDITSSSASSTLTPSSSTHSFSSSNHSIYAIYNSSANGTNGLSAGHAHASRQLRDIEVLKKQLENLNLKSELNSCHKVDIFPSELVKYDKEIQTRQSVLAHNNDNKKDSSNQNHAILNSSISLEAGDAITDEEDFDSSDPHFKESRSKKNRIQQLPLAFYEEVLVHDTFQWEDEFGHHHHNDHHGENKGHQELTDNMLKKNDDSRNKHSINGEVNHDSDTIDDDDIVEAIHNNPKHHRSSSHLSLFLDTNDIYRFLSEKRPVVERALKQNENDIFVDYTASNDDEKIRLEEENRVAVKFKKRIPAPEKYNNSVVTSLDWSLQHLELILASYDNSPINYVDLDNEAAIALWNVRSDLKSPQQLFTSTSLITASLFSPYQPNLIIAGTFSGQICMWDIRSNKRTPIQRTSLSSSSHVCPVYCVRVLDSASSGQNLVSISNDGKLCFWSLENLNSPMDTQDLIIKHATNRAVYATCMDFQNIANSNENDRRLAIVGTEDGLAHSFNISKFGVERTYEDHFGPLTSVNCHVNSTFQTLTQPNQDHTIQDSSDQPSSYSFSNLFLTSSFDSSVKLWNMTESSKPLYTFDNNGADYVFDVAWSPIHPSLFASVDGAGRLEFWNLNKSIEMATISVNVDNRRALNKLKWSPRKGTEIIVGDDQGELSIYELSENFSSPSPDEFEKFEKTINSIQKLNQEFQSLINSDISLA